MPTWIDLAPFAVLALLGSLHCAGMCGGFSVAVAVGPGRGAAARRWSAYVIGKALTYAALGAAVALAGAALIRGGAEVAGQLGAAEPGALATSRRALAWVAGIALVALGLSPILRRASRSAPAIGPWRRAVAVVGDLYGSVRALPGWAGGFGTGVLGGLLPCGLSWSALVLAFASPPAVAASGLFLFGVATAPGLAIPVLGLRALPAGWRRRGAGLASVGLVALGALTCIRGGLPESVDAAEEILPSCCSEVEPGP